MKIGIIGAGRVGATTAFCIAKEGIADEIVLIDVNNELAEGEAEDINQGLTLFPKETIVKAGDYKNLKDAKIIILTAGLRRKESETRLELINKNLLIIKDITDKLNPCKNSLILIVSNPVDIMTYLVLKRGGFKENYVFGLGTYLDTLRLFSILKRKKSKAKDAMVIGEHGDSMVFLSCKDKGIMDMVRDAGAWMIKYKQGTGWAVAMACLDVIRAIVFDEKRVFPLSSLVSNWYGVSGICISVPTMIGKDGIIGYPDIKLTKKEKERFLNSARIIKEEITRLNL